MKVTNAFDPSPPLRHDCDEIFSPSTGAGCPGVIASAVAGSKDGSFAIPTVVGGAAWDETTVARRTGLLSAGLLA